MCVKPLTLTTHRLLLNCWSDAWLVTYRDGIPAGKRSPIQVYTNRTQHWVTSFMRRTALLPATPKQRTFIADQWPAQLLLKVYDREMSTPPIAYAAVRSVVSFSFYSSR